MHFVQEDVTHTSIMRGVPASAEGGNRTLIPVGNTILSRARLPIPPLRLIVADPAPAGRPKVYHSQHEGQDKIAWSGHAVAILLHKRIR